MRCPDPRDSAAPTLADLYRFARARAVVVNADDDGTDVAPAPDAHAFDAAAECRETDNPDCPENE